MAKQIIIFRHDLRIDESVIYFRVFNSYTQGEKFDNDWISMKSIIKELKTISRFKYA